MSCLLYWKTISTVFPLCHFLPLTFVAHPSHCLCLWKKQCFCLRCCSLCCVGFFNLSSSSALCLPLLLSGWNCCGGQRGLCRWPSSLPWWCSAPIPCPVATVTIGDRQVQRVSLQNPSPSSPHNRLITLSLQRYNTCSLNCGSVPGPEQGQPLSLFLRVTHSDLLLGLDTNKPLFDGSSLHRYKCHLSCQWLSTQKHQCGCDRIYSLQHIRPTSKSCAGAEPSFRAEKLMLNQKVLYTHCQILSL